MPFPLTCRVSAEKSACTLVGVPFLFPRCFLYFLGLPWWLRCKESACNAGDQCSIPGLGRSPGGGHDNPLQYCCLENPLGQRSLTSYSPWGSKELDTTERLMLTLVQCESWTIKKAWAPKNLCFSNCGVGEDSWDSLRQQDPTSRS